MKINIFILTLITLFFTACSFKSYENQWQFDSSIAFNSYVQNAFKGNTILAKDDLSKAIKYAKQGANFNQLARIYLGECAIDLGLGIKNSCEKYKKIENLVSSNEIKVYSLLLEEKVDKNQIKFLPKQYQEFYKYKLKNNQELAFESLKKSEQISSLFIAAKLIKKMLNKSQINFLIEKASFYGYKKLVIYWLKNLYEIESNKNKRDMILKKINILLN